MDKHYLYGCHTPDGETPKYFRTEITKRTATRIYYSGGQYIDASGEPVENWWPTGLCYVDRSELENKGWVMNASRGDVLTRSLQEIVMAMKGFGPHSNFQRG